MGIRKKTVTTRIQEPAGVQFGLNSSHAGNISAIGIGRLHRSLSGRASELLRLEQDGAPSLSHTDAGSRMDRAPVSTVAPNRQHPGPRHCQLSPSRHRSLHTAPEPLWPGRGLPCSPTRLPAFSLWGPALTSPCGSPEPFLPSPSSSSTAAQFHPGGIRLPSASPAPPMTRPPQRKCGHPRDPPTLNPIPFASLKRSEQLI